MPYAAPHICACGKVVTGHCACGDADRKAVSAAYQKTRPSRHQRGYGHLWDQARKEFLALNPRCQWPDCSAFATTVDHIIPHKGDTRLFWDRKNWQGLCGHHHSSTKQAMERRQ